MSAVRRLAAMPFTMFGILFMWIGDRIGGNEYANRTAEMLLHSTEFYIPSNREQKDE